MPGMIVAPQPLAVEEGARVLAAGGNAFDAALACAAVQFLVDPHSCGVGGYLVMTCNLGDKRGPQPILDAPAVAGSLVEPTMWEKEVLRPNPDGWGYFLKGKINEDGYMSICTPGMLRGMQAIHRQFCTWKWADLFQTAIHLGYDGWQVGEHLAARWKDPAPYPEASSSRDKLHVTHEAMRIYLKAGGSTYEMTDTLRNPDYSRILEGVAMHGADDFYTGSLSQRIVADFEAHHASVTARDLSQYAIRSEPAVTTTYRGYTVVTNQAPHGGPTLAAVLNILEGYDLRALGHNTPAYIHRVSLAMKAAFADRNRHLGDPQFAKVPLEWMISPERAAEWRKVIESGQPIDVGRGQRTSNNTTQVCVVDHRGNCVSLTHSLGSSSGVITPGLGFMYNNSMVNFDPFAGNPNSIAPRKGRTTGMTPTVVLKNDRPVLVLGAPGATRIITSVLQVILNRLDFGMSILESVYAPRFDCQGELIRCQARVPESVCAELRKLHPVARMPRSHGGLALVHAIAIDEASGQLSGAADTGADGMALLVN